ncbi:MAG: carbon storage regulator [Xanthomonadales bacterium]|nr:carbon storage regulator [Xanthomonadales bacterium]
MKGDGGFLCLSRCVGRSVFIGDDIQVKIYGLCGPEGVPLDGISVRLAIKAPRGVLILRDENKDKEKP